MSYEEGVSPSRGAGHLQVKTGFECFGNRVGSEPKCIEEKAGRKRGRLAREFSLSSTMQTLNEDK